MADDAEVRITLRLPENLRDRLAKAADQSERSMNGEIIERLDWSFERAAQERADLLKLVHEQDNDIRDLRAQLKAPEAEISRLKKAFEQEREAYVRMEKLYENILDVAMNYRGLLRDVKRQILQSTTMIEYLAGIIMTIQGPPSEEVVKLAGRMERTAFELNEQIRQDPDLQKGREEMQEIDHLLAKASNLLKKNEEG